MDIRKKRINDWWDLGKSRDRGYTDDEDEMVRDYPDIRDV